MLMILTVQTYCYRCGKGNCRARPELTHVCFPSADTVFSSIMSLQVRRGPQIRKWGMGKVSTWRDGAAWPPWSPRCPQGPRQLSRMIQSSLRSSSNRKKSLNMALSCECGCYSNWISWGLWQSHIFSGDLGLAPQREMPVAEASAGTWSRAWLSQQSEFCVLEREI